VGDIDWLRWLIFFIGFGWTLTGSGGWFSS